MSGHTPGPWSVSLGDLVRVTAAGPKGGHHPVVVCGVHRIGKHLGVERAGEVEANANLIAAAPDLADVVRAFLLNRASITTHEPFQGALSRLFSMAEVAIAKATSPTMNTQAILRDQGRG